MKHARIQLEGDIHHVHVEANNAVRLSDGRLLAEDQVQWFSSNPSALTPATIK